jgi:hypothetical protein
MSRNLHQSLRKIQRWNYEFRRKADDLSLDVKVQPLRHKKKSDFLLNKNEEIFYISMISSIYRRKCHAQKK